MGIRIVTSELCPADIAHFGTASTSHLVATVALDNGCLALGALSNLGFGHGLLHLEPTFVFSLLLDNFVAAKRNMRLLSAFTTRLVSTVFDGTLKDNKIRREICLESTLGA